MTDNLESKKVKIRHATKKDLSAIMDVEQSWHTEGQASEDKFLTRLDRFSKGFFLAYIEDRHNNETVVATITAMPLKYHPLKVDAFTTWDTVTNNGFLYEESPEDCNALYIVSGVIDHRYRGLNIFTPMILKEVELARSLDYQFVLAGAVLPGYRKFCQKNGEHPAYEYCTYRRGKHLADPLLAMYEAIDFHIPNEEHVIPEYFPDDASKNFAGLVVHQLKD